MGSGSNLIPITDSSIAVQKEILKITRVENDFVEVDVYYEFYNDGDAKEMLIGFEAMSPSGDVGTLPVNERHPYISDFTVIVNRQSIAYKVAKVRDSVYYTYGVFNEIASDDYELSGNIQYVDFFYVYHFTCEMKQGVNIVKHTYRQELSSSVMENYSFDYVLSAASRWRGGLIQDFTLILDFGKFQEFNVNTTFFKNEANWQCRDGFCMFTLYKDSLPEYMSPHLNCILEKGSLVFKQKEFVPNEELHVVSYSYAYFSGNSFNYLEDRLPYSLEMLQFLDTPEDLKSVTILRNLPFARRGCVFKTDYIQEYFERQVWYKRNDSYKAKVESLTQEETEWVLNWSE
jgi:hypothetical protein